MIDRGLIITADDFGLSQEVNEAVEEAHRNGVLTCASLMVTGPAAPDAVRRAARMPGLGVGLHLALLDAPSARPASEIPDLVSSDLGTLGQQPVRLGMAMALSGVVRAQVRAEMQAQLELFARTGLALDHVNGHWHFHQHPVVIDLLAGPFASQFAIGAVRAPREPAWRSWRAGRRRGLLRRVGVSLKYRMIWRLSAARRRKAGLRSNDWFFGLNDAGTADVDRLLGFIRNLPPGVTEIGLHPASGPQTGPFAPPATWRQRQELDALTDARVAEACRRVRLGRFCDFLAPWAAGE
jgi:hopanoid biosynthesis associated protein HpnK